MQQYNKLFLDFGNSMGAGSDSDNDEEVVFDDDDDASEDDSEYVMPRDIKEGDESGDEVLDEDELTDGMASSPVTTNYNLNFRDCQKTTLTMAFVAAMAALRWRDCLHKHASSVVIRTASLADTISFVRYWLLCLLFFFKKPHN